MGFDNKKVYEQVDSEAAAIILEDFLKAKSVGSSSSSGSRQEKQLTEIYLLLLPLPLPLPTFQSVSSK